MLDFLLARDRRANVSERLEVNQPMNPILLRKSIESSSLVLEYANGQIIRDAGIENAGLAGHDVDEKFALAHRTADPPLRVKWVGIVNDVAAERGMTVSGGV